MIRNTSLIKTAGNFDIAGATPGYIDTMEIRCANEAQANKLVRLAFGSRPKSRYMPTGNLKFKTKNRPDTWAVYKPKDAILAIYFPPVSIFSEKKGAVL
jgi:hypothetical protein